MLDKTSKIITQEIPQALDDVQDTMPNLIQTAGTVDQSLAFLSAFKFSIPVPFSEPLEIGLGVDYDPEVPFEESIENLSGNLEDIPDQLRSIEADLVTVDLNLAVMSEDLAGISTGLDQMRIQIADINPVLENVITSMNAIQGVLEDSRGRIPDWLDLAQKIYTGTFIFLILTQIPSAYLGLLMLKGDFHVPKEEPILSTAEPPEPCEHASENPDPQHEDSKDASNKEKDNT
jgi:hypothetical protein